MTRLRWLTAVVVMLMIIGITVPIAFKTQYDRAVDRCVATPPGSAAWTGAQHGFSLSPLGFWCEHTFPDGTTDRENYGLVP